MDFEHCQKIIKEIIEEAELKDYNIIITKGSKDGDNYLGNIYRINVVGIKNNKKEKLQLIVKSAPTDLEFRNYLKINELYTRESFVYSKLLPSFKVLQDKYCFREKERYNYAKLLKHCDEELKETLLFEDLTLEGFVMNNKQSFDREHLFLAIENLAKFHAAGFALKDKCPELFEETMKVSSNKEVYRDVLKSYSDKIRPAVLKACKHKQYEDKFLQFYENIHSEFIRCSSSLTTAPYNAICHGDFRSNNMLFKYQNGKPIDLVVLDYQMLVISTPMSDISYMLFSELDKDVRKLHYNEVLEFYYKIVSQNVTRMKTDINKVYPENIFWDHVKNYMKVGWILALMLLPFIHGEEGKSLNANDMINSVDDGGFEEAPITEFGQQRIKEMIEDFIEYDMF